MCRVAETKEIRGDRRDACDRLKRLAPPSAKPCVIRAGGLLHSPLPSHHHSAGPSLNKLAGLSLALTAAAVCLQVPATDSSHPYHTYRRPTCVCFLFPRLHKLESCWWRPHSFPPFSAIALSLAISLCAAGSPRPEPAQPNQPNQHDKPVHPGLSRLHVQNQHRDAWCVTTPMQIARSARLPTSAVVFRVFISHRAGIATRPTASQPAPAG